MYWIEIKFWMLSWEYDYTGDIRTVDTLVKQLRRKLGEECNYIHTVYGVGYIFGENKGEL